MKLLKNPTSPFARIAHAALIEAGIEELEIQAVDPWADEAELLSANSAGRVPCLVLDDGTAITECLLIAAFAERQGKGAGILATSDPKSLAVAGIGIGVCDAAVQILIGRRIVSGDFADRTFDANPIAARRRRSVADGLTRLDAMVADAPAERLDIGTLAAVTALDYIELRFPGAEWIPATPRLSALREQPADRPALAATRPPL
ncbi:MAG TPA: glutathione S-transferase [Aurantimonas coralicida]|uniref:Glutathione S-transferase n=2 Tax=root TaxID=1 RepID=A0A9C9NIY3_9HYPH|nr:glutathione S-transferase [Aurantimonas coralicida]HEU02810.1 glutathione S-transferase [Aurantimonas coralicida]